MATTDPARPGIQGGNGPGRPYAELWADPDLVFPGLPTAPPGSALVARVGGFPTTGADQVLDPAKAQVAADDEVRVQPELLIGPYVPDELIELAAQALAWIPRLREPLRQLPTTAFGYLAEGPDARDQYLGCVAQVERSLTDFAADNQHLADEVRIAGRGYIDVDSTTAEQLRAFAIADPLARWGPVLGMPSQESPAGPTPPSQPAVGGR